MKAKRYTPVPRSLIKWAKAHQEQLGSWSALSAALGGTPSGKTLARWCEQRTCRKAEDMIPLQQLKQRVEAREEVRERLRENSAAANGRSARPAPAPSRGGLLDTLRRISSEGESPRDLSRIEQSLKAIRMSAFRSELLLRWLVKELGSLELTRNLIKEADKLCEDRIGAEG